MNSTSKVLSCYGDRFGRLGERIDVIFQSVEIEVEIAQFESNDGEIGYEAGT